MADAPTGCDDARHESCIAGQVFCVRESGNVAYLQPDQRRENFTQAGDGAQQPDRRGRFEHGSDARFDGLHLCFELVKGRELHLDHRGGMRWQLVDYAVDVDSSPDAEEIADAGGVQAVAVNGCVDAVLEGSAQIAQSHAGAQQFALIAQIAGRDPALGEGSIMQQDGESLGVEGIGLVGFAHALFSFGGVGQMGMVTGALHLIDHPVPVAGGFERNFRTGRQGAEESDVFLAIMADTNGRGCFACLIDGNKD